MTGCLGGPQDCVEVDTGLGIIRFLGVLEISKDLELKDSWNSGARLSWYSLRVSGFVKGG